MNFFYTPKEHIDEQTGVLELVDEEAHHASNVLRYAQGQEIHVVDGEGQHYEGTIKRIDKKKVLVDIHATKGQSGSLTTLALGVIKNRQRLEFAIEKAVELGVGRIVLFDAENSEKSNVRLSRIRNIILSAMKQSLRAWLPKVEFYNSLDEIIEELHNEAFLVAHEKSNPIPADTVDWAEISRLPHTVFIGPEGGFSEKELDRFGKHENTFLINLGSARLRTETAVTATLSRFLPFRLTPHSDL